MVGMITNVHILILILFPKVEMAAMVHILILILFTDGWDGSYGSFHDFDTCSDG